jgi:hypothetical protein
MAKIRTEVYMETREVVTIKRKRTFFRSWCEGCERYVNSSSLQEAALLSGHDQKAICSMLEERVVHFCGQKLDGPMICLRSLCLS